MWWFCGLRWVWSLALALVKNVNLYHCFTYIYIYFHNPICGRYIFTYIYLYIYSHSYIYSYSCTYIYMPSPSLSVCVCVHSYITWVIVYNAWHISVQGLTHISENIKYEYYGSISYTDGKRKPVSLGPGDVNKWVVRK